MVFQCFSLETNDLINTPPHHPQTHVCNKNLRPAADGGERSALPVSTPNLTHRRAGSSPCSTQGSFRYNYLCPFGCVSQTPHVLCPGYVMSPDPYARSLKELSSHKHVLTAASAQTRSAVCMAPPGAAGFCLASEPDRTVRRLMQLTSHLSGHDLSWWWRHLDAGGGTAFTHLQKRWEELCAILPPPADGSCCLLLTLTGFGQPPPGGAACRTTAARPAEDAVAEAAGRSSPKHLIHDAMFYLNVKTN